MKCRHVSTTEPRLLTGRHLRDCEASGCEGCEPCPDRHCVVCYVQHTDYANPVTCPECVGEVRAALDRIADLDARLHPEAENRARSGDRPDTVLGGDAMVMLAMTQRENNGQVDAWHGDWDRSHESVADPYPPLAMLATWEDAYRDHLGHDPAGRATVTSAAGYLGNNLTRISQDAVVPFGEFARDVRRAVSRLEGVLHDQAAGDIANVACFDCGGELERKLLERKSTCSDHRRDVGGFEDTWTCARCRRRYTYAEYNFALRAKLETRKASA